MSHIKLLKILSESIGIKTLYHGNKSGKKLNDIATIYLTPVYRYALSYAKGNEDGVTEVKVNIGKLLDLRFLGVNNFDAKLFYQRTGLYFPSSLLIKNPNKALWELVRLDFNDQIRKSFESKGYDGLIMIEQKGGEMFESYILFNSSPIIELN